MNDHSPAPWHSTNAGTQIRDAKGSMLAEVRNFNGATEKPRSIFQIRENSKLMVAAPTLLAAARELVSYLGPWAMDYGNDDPQLKALNALDAAIEKATA